MRDFKSLSGNHLENWFEYLFKNKLKFEHYYPCSGQVQLTALDSQATRGHHLEIDGVLLLNKTAILMEFTAEQSKIKDKIRKFTRSCNLFTTSIKSLREKFQLFQSIPENKLLDFEEVDNWRFVFFGTSRDIDKKNIKPSDFPDFPNIRDKLAIFGAQNIEYIAELSDLINQYAKYEFLSALNFSPQDLGQNGLIEKDFIKAENHYVTENPDIKADIYLLSFKPKELLEIGRVSRYEGIPFALESEHKSQYQRFLVKPKLDNIANKFITNDRRKAFPNTVTLVLSNECRIDPDNPINLLIPNRYSSIDIIDGQHRIFAYANPNISPSVLENAEILASAIKFQTDDQNKINKHAAKIFCEINSKQAKVKNSLLYLIKYDVLGDRDPIALAGKVILECNKGNRALGDIFLINSLDKKNKFNMSPISIVTIVGQDLCKFMNGEGISRILDNQEFQNIFGHDKDYLLANSNQWWRKGKNIIEQYFNYFKEVFQYDWKENSESYILSSKYISALIRLLRDFMIDQSLSLSDIRQRLRHLKTAVDAITNPSSNSASFPLGNDLIPSTRYGIKTIYDFLKNPRTDWKS